MERLNALASRQRSVLSSCPPEHGPTDGPSASLVPDQQGLLNQALCLSRYWERFGGFGQSKELALIAFQVTMIMDAMQAGKIPQAQDHLALLAVLIEQAVLDGGRFDLAYWLEEPPSSMLVKRNSTGFLRSPLASQRWVTVVRLLERAGSHPVKAPGLDKIPAFGSWARSQRGRRGTRRLKPELTSPGTPGAKIPDFKGLPSAPSSAHVASSLSTTITFHCYAASLPRWLA